MHQILIVDDSKPLADNLAELLEMHGYATITHYDGHDCVKRVRSGGIGAVICDYHMPGLNGGQVLKSLREFGFTDLLFIMISSDNEAAPAIRDRVTHFVTKPINLKKLLQLLEQTLPE